MFIWFTEMLIKIQVSCVLGEINTDGMLSFMAVCCSIYCFLGSKSAWHQLLFFWEISEGRYVGFEINFKFINTG